mmetsp:Transcript_131777/g.332867  ORF Transcript_131777/g.332867 Transcript_131777/m.332867 type:complete len:433 (+) Transcript_131777:133-1431(+)
MTSAAPADYEPCGLDPEDAPLEAIEDPSGAVVAADHPHKGPQKGFAGFLDVVAGNPFLSAFLVVIPFGFLTHFLGMQRWLVFLCNFFAILPMAWLIGKSTEDLATYTGEAAGGMLNATFGNVVEMLLCVAGIRQNQISVVQCTLIGSILSNMLLVMGTSFLWGGYNLAPSSKMQYSKVGASAQSTLMLLAVLGITLPTVYSMLMPGQQEILDISRGCSSLLIVVYFQFLVFQLKTHKADFEGEEDGGDDEYPDMTAWTSVVVLATCTVLTAFCSEYLIDAIEGTIEAWHVSKEFIGIIILPIIGNAAEHYTAIVVAGQNKMDLSLGVAVGSSCQMALMVTPFTVLAGWALDKPMSLNFHPFQVTVLFMAVLIVANILRDGESNWLEGSMLVTAYSAIALIYYFETSSGNLAAGGFASEAGHRRGRGRGTTQS